MDQVTSPSSWLIRGQPISCDRPLVMGIVNATPDSFSDGGEFLDPSRAVEHAMQLLAEGADILDIGGESTRPGADPVSASEELRRVVPIIDQLARQTQALISIDTMKPAVARAALDSGAAIVNDVTGLADPAMRDLVSQFKAGAIVMHMQGTPQTMQRDPCYPDGVMPSLLRFFESRLRECSDAGIDPGCIAIDPGIGFGKTAAQCWELIARLSEFQQLRRPVCLGVSRKSFIGKATGREAPSRLYGSIAVACHALAHGAAQILRVHDVAATVDAVRIFARIDSSSSLPGTSISQ